MSDADDTALRCALEGCGVALPVGASFCPKCGNPVNEQQRRVSEHRMRRVRPPSMSEPVFAKACEEYATALARGVTENDRALASRARDLANTFRSFATATPKDDIKRAALERFADLQRAALERLHR